jgi:leader peptidase (prepilin peptidase) / N-methyltransferase
LSWPSPAPGEPALSIALAILGLAWGIVADRIAARWPAHEDGSVRPVDWRTATVPVVAAIAFYLLAGRFPDQGSTIVFSLVFGVLILLLAIDLDQRLLPDELTLPLAGFALVYGLTGRNPLIGTDVPAAMLPALLAAIVIPAIFFALSIPFGPGAFGLGDVKLLFGVGLLAGFARTALGVIGGVLLSGVVIVVLLVLRRISLKSFIPYGPFLIIGAFWAVLLSS